MIIITMIVMLFLMLIIIMLVLNVISIINTTKILILIIILIIILVLICTFIFIMIVIWLWLSPARRECLPSCLFQLSPPFSIWQIRRVCYDYGHDNDHNDYIKLTYAHWNDHYVNMILILTLMMWWCDDDYEEHDDSLLDCQHEENSEYDDCKDRADHHNHQETDEGS